MTVVTEPVAPGVLAVLRRAVLDHNRSVRRRRHFAPVLHAGVPGDRQRVFEIEPRDRIDAALRIDVVEALVRPFLGHADTSWIWLTRRAGDPVLASDLAWAAAVRAAAGELRHPLGLVVVTRNGWRDPCSGVGRSWARLRAR